MQLLKSENQESDEIVFYDNVYYFMKESTDEIIEIFVSTEFNKFLHNHKPLAERRKIIDYIMKYDISHKNSSEKKSELLKFVISHFHLIANLYLDFKGKLIF